MLRVASYPFGSLTILQRRVVDEAPDVLLYLSCILPIFLWRRSLLAILVRSVAPPPQFVLLVLQHCSSVMCQLCVCFLCLLCAIVDTFGWAVLFAYFITHKGGEGPCACLRSPLSRFFPHHTHSPSFPFSAPKKNNSGAPINYFIYISYSFGSTVCP